MKASQIMTRGVRSVPPDATVEAVARLLLAHAISAVPVVDPQGVPLGVVSEADFVRRPELETQKRRAQVTVVVADGVVELLGMVTSAPERDALRILAREVPGVREVRDHLVVRPMPFVAGVM